jgi:SAM-dependent methyltransferase
LEDRGFGALALVQRIKASVAKALEKMGWVAVRKKTLFKPFTRQYSKANLTWDLNRGGRGIGGWETFPNASRGYHGILLQWFEHYHSSGEVLVVSESRSTAALFQKRYPRWTWITLDLFTDINEGQPDHVVDICGDMPGALVRRFGSILCQATLEHVYDPMAAMRNLAACLAPGGFFLLHTHTPPFMYHPCPRDYFRFNVDWFEDIEKHIPQLVLLELVAMDGHICCAFGKAG